jgi:urease accessory protein
MRAITTIMVEPPTEHATGLEAETAYKLLAWFSPAMPIGAYTYSHGLEYAVEAGLVTNPGSLRGYVETALRDGTGQLDATLLCAAHRAGRDGTCDGRALVEIAVLAAALRGSSELALESAAQGRALLTLLRRAWPAPALDGLAELCRAHEIEPAHSVVVGVACAAHQLPQETSVVALLHGFAANLISAGVRLIPLGQTDGQRLTAALETTIRAVADEALTASLDDLGMASPMIDLCAIAHETQYTRLFRS